MRAKWFFCRVFLGALCLFLSACVAHSTVPVSVTSLQQEGVLVNEYIVRPGDSVYLIAWQFDLDYKTLVRLNNLKKPYVIHPGKRFLLREKPPVAQPESLEVKRLHRAYRAHKPSQALRRPVQHVVHAKQLDHRLLRASKRSGWFWPASGKVVAYYDHAHYQKGIDILLKGRVLVRAAYAGEIVYLGHDVVGRYGDLCIIRHEGNILSAYAGPLRFIRPVGAFVRAGEVIGKVKAEAKKKILHFEVRENGRAVDPVRYLT
jgi:lipoprotein NlpD